MRKTIQMLGTLAIAAALTMTMASCSSDKETVENPAQPTQPTQPMTSSVTVTVGAGMATDGATTRSAVANDNGDRVLKFTSGDKLYVYGANNDASIAGELTMVANSLSNDGLSAQFTGTIKAYDLSSGNEKTNYSWGEDPLSGTKATLIHNAVNSNAISYTVGSPVTVNYNMYASDVETLMTSCLKIQGDYANGTGYTLSSSDPILNCTISGLTALTAYTFTLKKGNTSANNVSITTGADGAASFAFASMESGSATWSIEVKQGNTNVGTISLGTMEFTAKVYNITRDWTGSQFAKVTDLSATGNANTYIVSSAGTYKFDATVKGNGGLDPLTGTTATKINKSSIAGVKVLWEVYDKGRAIKHDGTKYDISYNDGYVYFSTPDEFIVGDCYVAVYDSNDNILWSWLIWATATPSEQTVDSDKYMNCNLGSIQVAYCTRGFLYEWGRKDPFPSTKYGSYDSYDYYPARMTCYSYVTSSQSVSYAIEHPTTYIPGAWMTEADYRTDLWSDTQKTIYDPCPIGWRVPTSSQMSTFKRVVGLGNLPATGFIGGINNAGDFSYGNPNTGYYWSSTGVNRSNALASCNDGRLNYDWPVNEGYAIRPVKE